jgi:hypothetical protein
MSWNVKFLQLDSVSVRNMRKRLSEAPGALWHGPVPNTSAVANVRTSASYVGVSLDYSHLRPETIIPDRAFSISLVSSWEICTLYSGSSIIRNRQLGFREVWTILDYLLTQYFPLELLLQYIVFVVCYCYCFWWHKLLGKVYITTNQCTIIQGNP